MSQSELFVSQSNVFSGLQKPHEKADFVVFGVPFDSTSTYRTGARFGPSAIRQASLNIETFSFQNGIDIEDVSLHDLGDIQVYGDAKRTIETVAMVVNEIFATGKKPVTIGGEHTITLGIMRGLGATAEKTAVVSFDAHLDLRQEFLGLNLSHTTFMRRMNEETKPARIVGVGTRAVCREELSYAKKAGIEFFTSDQIRNEGTEEISRCICQKLKGYEKIYLSIDMDILDPAYAPAVQNPEPAGIDTGTLLDLLCKLVDKRVVGFDVSEVAPDYDQGITAISAAKVIIEVICQIEKARRR
ncbi:agmatinase [Candidatus Bathyarchaeota archaeon]|nr:agmatinase [Candidatus Bathyarchaeota archaeon]